MPVTYGNIAGQEPSTVTFRVRTVVIPMGSTSEQQEILTLGDPQTSNALARVLDAAPGSTEFGLVTRVAGSANVAQNSTVWATQAAQSGAWTVLANLSSTSTDNPVAAVQSGAWTVTVSGYSTTAQVSSVGGIVTVQPNSTQYAANAGFHFNSSGELLTAGAAGAAGSTIVTVSTGSFGLAGAYDSSNTLIKVADSANDAIRVNVVAGAAGGSTVVTISAKRQGYGAVTALAITSSGLAPGSARQSAVVDNTASTSQYSDFNLYISRKGTSGSSAFVDFYVYTSLGDTNYTDSATGTDAAFTSSNRTQSRYLGSILMSTAPRAVPAYFKLSDIFATMPSRWGLIEINNSAGNLSSTNADIVTNFEGVY